MPMYEYACRKCGHSFEKLVKSMSNTDPIFCPKCQSKQTDRKFSVFAVNGDSAAKSLASSASAPRRGGCGCGHGHCMH